MSKTEQLLERLIQAELCPPDEIRGCSQKQLRQIEKCAAAPLPADYLETLSLIGCHAGHFMSDLDFFYPAMLSLTDHDLPQKPVPDLMKVGLGNFAVQLE